MRAVLKLLTVYTMFCTGHQAEEVYQLEIAMHGCCCTSLAHLSGPDSLHYLSCVLTQALHRE